MQAMGAKSDEIKSIKDSINQLVSKAGVKQENMNDKIGLLKKVEIKFQAMVERRKVFEWFFPKDLRNKEQTIKSAT